MMIEELLLGLGYLGAFLAGLISSVGLFLPTPGFVVVFALAVLLNPVAVGILSGFGAAIGEVIGYVVGYGADKYVLSKKEKTTNMLNKLDYYFKKYNPTLILFVFAATPLPFDVAGMMCGVIKYPLWKFFVATLAGKLLKYLTIAMCGYYGITFITDLFGGTL